MLTIFKWLHSNLFGYSYIMPFYHLYKKLIINQFNVKMCIVFKFLSSKEAEKYINSMCKRKTSAFFAFVFILCLSPYVNRVQVLSRHSFGTAHTNLNKGTNFKWLFCFLCQEDVMCCTWESIADRTFRFLLKPGLRNLWKSKKHFSEKLKP